MDQGNFSRVNVINSGHKWTIPIGTFTGQNAEELRRLVLATAATMQIDSRNRPPPGKGAHCLVMSSLSAVVNAFQQAPAVFWASREDLIKINLTPVLQAVDSYDAGAEFVLCVKDPERISINIIPLHGPIYDGETVIPGMPVVFADDNSISSNILNTCAHCKKPCTRRCFHCKTVVYCDPTCQRQHWPQHKVACRQYLHSKT